MLDEIFYAYFVLEKKEKNHHNIHFVIKKSLLNWNTKEFMGTQDPRAMILRIYKFCQIEQTARLRIIVEETEIQQTNGLTDKETNCKNAKSSKK